MSKGMKMLWLAAALALALPSMTAMADGHMMGGMHGHGMHGMHDCHDHMAKALGLTEAQQKQVDALHTQAHKEMHPLWEQKHEDMHKLWTLNPDDKNYMAEVKKLAEKQGDLTEKMVIAHAQYRAKFYAILTAAQKEKLKQMREDHRHMHHHHRHMNMM